MTRDRPSRDTKRPAVFGGDDDNRSFLSFTKAYGSAIRSLVFSSIGSSPSPNPSLGLDDDNRSFLSFTKAYGSAIRSLVFSPSSSPSPESDGSGTLFRQQSCETEPGRANARVPLGPHNNLLLDMTYDSDDDDNVEISDEENVDETLNIARYFMEVNKWFTGRVVSRGVDRRNGTTYYHVIYADGQGEDMTEHQLEAALRNYELWLRSRSFVDLTGHCVNVVCNKVIIA